MKKRKLLTRSLAMFLAIVLVFGNGGFEAFNTLIASAKEPTESTFEEPTEELSESNLVEAPSEILEEASEQPSEEYFEELSEELSEEHSEELSEKTSEDLSESDEKEEYYYGYVAAEDEENVPTVKEGSFMEGGIESVLPSYYGSVSATDYSILLPSYIPKIRNQNPYGTCWAFASIALAEINMIKKGYISTKDADYSELALSYFCYNGFYDDPLGNFTGDEHSDNGYETDFLDHGGNCSTAGNLFAGWVGVTDESVAPYENALLARENGLPDSIAFNDAAHLENYYVINRETNPEYIKRAIMEYGAAHMSYFANSQYYNEEHNCFYNYVNTSTNHANVVIGWNDNFPKEYFGTDNQPEGDGAWLLRNSWAYEGTEEESYRQYFWISYYDTSLSTACYVFDVEEATNYDNNYQYDGTLSYSSTGAVSGGQIANVFTAKACESGESLEAVGYYFSNANVGYTVEVYLNPNDTTDPTSGTLQEDATVSGVTTFSGYYTIPLKESVRLNKGDKYSVVITLSSDTDDYIWVQYERNSESTDWKTVAYAQSGQSYMKWNPKNAWKDLGSEKGGNIRIKAFTKNVYDSFDDFSFTDGNLETEGMNLSIGDSADIAIEGVSAAAAFWTSEDEEIATVKNGVITGVSVGKTRIKVTLNGVEKSFEVRVFDLVLTGEESVYAGEIKDYNYLLSTEDNPIPEEHVTFSSSDTNLATIDNNGRATFKRFGKVTFTVEVSGIRAYKTVEIKIKNPEVHAGAFSDGITKVWWDAVPGADYYVIKRKNYSTSEIAEVARITADGREVYQLKDDSFKDDLSSWYTAWYIVYAYVNSSDSWVAYGSDFNYRSYELSYVLNGGTNPEDAPAYVRKTYSVVMPTPIRSGYRFDGWYLTSDFSDTPIGAYDAYVESDRTYYAKWSVSEAKNYTITFDENGGEVLSDEKKTKTVTTGNTYGELPTPVRTGYIFDGWYTHAASGKKITADQIVNLNADTTFYAQYTPITYYINFVDNGATKGSMSLQSLTYDTKQNLTSNAYVRSFTTSFSYEEADCDVDILSSTSEFKGWALSRNGEVAYSDGEEILNLTNQNRIINLYAVWEDGEITLPTATKEGYAFTGWHTEKEGGICIGKAGETISPTITRTLYARFDMYAVVTFDVNGGEALLEEESERRLLNGQAIGTLPTPTKKGSTFDGWYTQKDSGTKVTKDYIVTDSITLYAHWTEKTIKVVFYPNGADTDGTGYYYNWNYGTEYDVPDLTASTLQKRFVKLGYELAGYSLTKDGEVLFEQGGKINLNRIEGVSEDTKTVSLYAVWKAKTYKITFKSNGSENGKSYYGNYTYNKTYIISDFEDSSKYEFYYCKLGYHIAGFSFTDGGEVALKVGDSYSLSTLNLIDYDTVELTFYAVWEPNTYEVRFAGNGSENGRDYLFSTIKYDADYTVPDFTDSSKYEYFFVKTGHHLIGYSLTENGDVVLKPSEKYNLKKMGVIDKETTKVTFYAVWEVNTYTITFDGNKGEISVPTLSVTYEKKYGPLPTATRNSCEFIGWYDAPIGGNQITENTICKLLSDITLYAHWKYDLGDIDKYPEDYEELVANAVQRTGKTREEIEAEIVDYIPNGLWTAGVKAFDYTGKAITQPNLHVYFNNKILTPGTDCTIKYSNNVKASDKAAITITGKGRFTGSVVQYFTINRLDISKADADDIHVLFNNRIQKASPVLTYELNGKSVKLKKGTDYTLEYGAGDFSAVGTYTITVTGNGNYCGTKEVKEIIDANQFILMSKAGVAKIPDQYYTGEEIRLDDTKLLVTYQNMSLKEGEDYSVTYRNNREIGLASVTITGLGNEENTHAFVGSKTVTFRILGTSIAKAEVTVISDQMYNTMLIEPDVTVKLDHITLVKDKDYQVSYSNNTNKGKAKVTITGINAYYGTVTRTFNILAKPLNRENISMPADNDNTSAYVYNYTKGGTTPAPDIRSYGKVLIKNKDYSIKYTNHTASGKEAVMTVTGKGNYTGKVEVKYTIQTASISELNVLVSDFKATGKAGACNPAIEIIDVNGKKLSAGSDYYKTAVQNAKNAGSYTYKKNYEVKQKDGSVVTRLSGEKVRDTDILVVGMNLSVTIYGNGNYAGSQVTKDFRVVANDISKAIVKINKQHYTGKPIYLTNLDSSAYNYIYVKVGNNVLTDKDYEIVSYENNVEKGTAKVTIKGIGNYGGYKTINFTITPRNIRYTVILTDTHNVIPVFKVINIVDGNALPANSFKYTGHNFLGWSNQKGGSVVYQNKAKFTPTPDYATGSTIILFAVWD